MSKFGVVFLLVLLATAFLAAIERRRIEDVRQIEQGVAAHRRLTELVSGPLYLLLVAIALTILFIQPLLPEHYVVGFLLIPPLVFKLTCVGYRFGRYYTHSLSYRLAGPPRIPLRVSAPILVISTVAVFLSGIELWLFGLRFGSAWIELHTVSAVVLMLSSGVHVLGHFRPSAMAALEELTTRRSRETLTRRSFVVASLILGAVLALASLLYPTPFPPTAAGG